MRIVVLYIQTALMSCTDGCAALESWQFPCVDGKDGMFTKHGRIGTVAFPERPFAAESPVCRGVHGGSVGNIVTGACLGAELSPIWQGEHHDDANE
jgi:hypothetical protein